MIDVQIQVEDLDLPQHQANILDLLDMYARDVMGDGNPLSAYARNHLIEGLKATPTSTVFLAFVGDVSVGIAVCFRGFSTFAAKPLINIHDFAVMPEWRSRGIGHQILEAIEFHAKAMGCCKLTLEVQENNVKAQAVYKSFGFNRAQYVQESGKALFFVKKF